MARKIYNDRINIDKKMWLEILNDEITDKKTLDILNVLFKSNDYEERAGIIAEKLKYSHHAAINGIIKSYALRIIDKYPKINVPEYEDKRYALFHVLLLAEWRKGFWYWKLRPELAEVLKEYKPE
jgi:hypothetical protein